MVYAPVIITTCNRTDHLNELLNSLKKCKYADKTAVYISVDYPPSERYIAGHSAVCEFLEKIDSNLFEKFTVYYQKDNLGPIENFYFLFDKISEDGYEYCIVAEDDFIFAPSYLSYVNQVINRYKDDGRVVVISGIQRSENEDKTADIFLVNGHTTLYGAAYNLKFIDEMQNFIKTDNILKILKNPIVMTRFYKWNKRSFGIIVSGILINYLPSLRKKDGSLGLIDAWFALYVWLNKKITIYPNKMLAYNNGFDGSGLHSGKVTNPFKPITYFGTEYEINDVYIEEPQALRWNTNLRQKLRNFKILLNYYKWLLFNRKIPMNPG